MNEAQERSSSFDITEPAFTSDELHQTDVGKVQELANQARHFFEEN
jgi:hypothetical protein